MHNSLQSEHPLPAQSEHSKKGQKGSFPAQSEHFILHGLGLSIPAQSEHSVKTE
jgi:hypothetical protein